MDRLRTKLRQIDGRGYPAYKGIKGRYAHESFELEVIHVQGDPFAAPSRLSIRIPTERLTLDPNDISHRSRRIGLEDGMLRTFSSALRSFRKQRGSGKSGEWVILRPGQEILPRTACEVDRQSVTIRFTAGLPAAGRRILGREAIDMFCDELPNMVHKGMLTADQEFWRSHADASEDQDVLRNLLREKKWIAFIANESILPRASGIDDRPLGTNALPWKSPAQFEREVELPNRGRITGTAVPEGVTLICGGGYHGKSTVLQALARGVYNHIPGDGREFCSSLYETVAVRAEDGRSVAAVDISSFISNLPNGQDTSSFATENASGSTSQAANIVEAVEVGARTLLIDEDTSATNFMVRDRRMQELVITEKEPITPFIDRVRELYDLLGISTLLVIGGSGDYFDVADHVIVMESYCPRVETERAKEIAAGFPSERSPEKRPPLTTELKRAPASGSFDPRRGRRPERVRTTGTRSISFGVHEIDMSLVSQLIDDGQTRTIGDWLLECSRGDADGQHSLSEICDKYEKKTEEKSLSATTAFGYGDRVFCRRFELAAAINRLRTLSIVG